MPAPWLDRIGVTPEQASAWAQQARAGLNSPITHAAGRVFDSFSVLLGFAHPTVTYDGQAAIRLETAARRYAGPTPDSLPFQTVEKDGMLVIDWSAAFAMLLDLRVVTGRETEWAMAAHRAIAAAAAAMVYYGLSQSKWRRVGLTGGVFMNRILNDLLIAELQSQGVEALLHRQTPPNDGCISVGQVVAAGMSQVKRD